MAIYPRGTVAVLAAEFREFEPDGPLTDVDNLSITVVPLLGGDPALEPTTTPFSHPATGIYGFEWDIPSATEAGLYVVIWSGDMVGTETPLQATQQIQITYQNSSSDLDGPCDWEIDTTCAQVLWDSFTPAQQEVGYYLATTTLWALTGRRFGQCEITVQPCRPRRQLPLYMAFPVPAFGYGVGNADGYLVPFSPYILDGNWYNGCWGGCRCRASCELPLDGPTTTADVVAVMEHGVLVPPSAYQIHNNHLLVRIDGNCWPTCVNYSQQDPPAFQVTYRRGNPVPRALQIAAGTLAVEYARACAGDGECRLPSRLQSLAQQGVSVTMGPINDYLDLGLTDIPEVDRIVTAYNPYRQQERSRVYSPDRQHPRMVT